MRIDAAEYRDGRLVLTVPAPDALRWLYIFKPGEHTIKKEVKRRSINANSYAWSLMSQISSAIGVPTEDVYRHCIENIGGQSTALTIGKNAYRAFQKAFIGEHIGRSVKIIGETEEAYDVLVTYGSSDYDTKQMAQLIDSIVQECKALGIQTKEDEYINGLIEDWERSHEK